MINEDPPIWELMGYESEEEFLEDDKKEKEQAVKDSEDAKIQQKKALEASENKFGYTPEQLNKIEDFKKIARPSKNYENFIDSKLKLDLNLPEDNFIMQYIKYASTQSDAYSEWHFAGAVSLLSIIANRRIVLKLKSGDIYTNIWFMGLGDSTISRKTTGMSQAENFIQDLNLNNRLADSFSPERFIEDLNYNPSAFFWKDEAAGLFATMQRTYMSDMRDLFCAIYENKPYHRALRTSQRKEKITEFDIWKPYLCQWLLTTPGNFKAYANSLDITSGWLLRYLYLNPSYIKDWKAFQLQEQDDLDKRRILVKLLKEKRNLIKISINKDFEIEMKPTEEAWKYYSEWQKVSEEKLQKSDDATAQGIFGRLETYALKLAMLFEFGKPEFTYSIELDTIMEACRIIDEYFLPTSVDIIQELENNQKNNLVIKIRQILRKNRGEIKKTKLLQTLSLPVKQVDESLDMLKESQEIVIEGIKGTNWIRSLKVS